MDEMIASCVLLFSLWMSVASEELIIKASPSRRAVAGGYLDLSCSISTQSFPIMWRKNGDDIAENCIIFKDSGFKCKKSGGAYHLIKSSLGWEDRGTWTCSHGPKIQKSIEVEVVVPALVYPLTARKSVPLKTDSYPIVTGPASIQSDASVNRGQIPLYGTGSRRDPLDMTLSNAPREIVLECSTTCSSIQPHIQWRARNSSWTMTLQPQRESDLAAPDGQTVTSETCFPGLHAIRERVRLMCAANSPKRSNNGLVGLNRITCQPDHGSDQGLIQSVLTSGPLIDVYPSTGVQSSWGVGDYGPDECALKGTNLDACVYVLCPGQPTSWFTLGERIALAVSITLFILLAILLCYLTRQRRRAKRKSNLAPGQRHEIELML